MAFAVQEPSNSTQASMTPLQYALNFFSCYIGMAVIMLGCFGNILSLTIFIKRRKQDRASAQYLGLLAVFDFLSLSVAGTINWLHGNLLFFTGDRVYFSLGSNLRCQMFIHFMLTVQFMSGFIIVLFSIERLLVIWFPLKMAAKFSSSKPRKRALAILLVIGLSLPSGVYFSVGSRPVVPDSPHKICLRRSDIPFWHHILHTCFIHMCMSLPCVFIAFLNMSILIGIYNKSREMNDVKNTKNTKNENRAVANLLMISTCYFVLISPFAIVETFHVAADMEHDEKQASFIGQFIMPLVTLTYFNFAINPILYLFNFKFYRAEAKKILCMYCSKEDAGSNSQKRDQT